LEDSTSGLRNSLEIVFLNSTSAEDTSISEVLGSEITNWQVRENNFSSGLANLVQFTINDVPLSVNDLLEIFWVIDSNLCVILLGLQFELDIQKSNLWVLKALWLLLETSIGEGLLEADTSNHE
jgi:hypothetical protein